MTNALYSQDRRERIHARTCDVQSARRTSRNEGYALVAVLWTLALLSLIAAALISHSRSAARVERNAWNRLRAETIAEAATDRAILAILDSSRNPSRRFYGASMPFVFEGVRVDISIQDELGKVDLNAASADRLRALMSAAGFSVTDADTMSQRILEWREPDDHRRTRRVSVDDYGGAGLPYGPRRGPFQSIDELRLVLGMTDEMFESLRPAVSVYSQAGAVDPQVAPELVLRAVPGLSASALQEIFAERSAPASLEAALDDGAPGGATRLPLNGRSFAISVRVHSSNSPLNVETIIRLTGDPHRPYWVLETTRF